MEVGSYIHVYIILNFKCYAVFPVLQRNTCRDIPNTSSSVKPPPISTCMKKYIQGYCRLI